MITTSRHASPETREAARAMALRAGCVYIARGKKTVAELAEKARKAGDSQVMIAQERGGRAARLAMLEVDALGRWRWGGERLLNSTEKADSKAEEGS